MTITTMTTPKSNQGITNSQIESMDTFSCHEKIDDYQVLRTDTRFWLEGVLLLIAGIIGIIGNCLSILVLPGCAGNRNFNILLL